MRLKKNEQLSNFTNQLKIILTVIFSFWFIITLNACGIFVNTATSKSTELSEKYNFYEKSVNNIRTNCNVTPEQADEIFLVLVDNCGVSDLINYVFKNNDSDKCNDRGVNDLKYVYKCRCQFKSKCHFSCNYKYSSGCSDLFMYCL